MPKGIRKLQIIFGETHLTHFGGIFLIHWFCQKLKQAIMKYFVVGTDSICAKIARLKPCLQKPL
jgi:hypothetical protein